jgi:hypothetical protein
MSSTNLPFLFKTTTQIFCIGMASFLLLALTKAIDKGLPGFWLLFHFSSMLFYSLRSRQLVEPCRLMSRLRSGKAFWEGRLFDRLLYSQ